MSDISKNYNWRESEEAFLKLLKKAELIVFHKYGDTCAIVLIERVSLKRLETTMDVYHWFHGAPITGDDCRTSLDIRRSGWKSIIRNAYKKNIGFYVYKDAATNDLMRGAGLHGDTLKLTWNEQNDKVSVSLITECTLDNSARMTNAKN